MLHDSFLDLISGPIGRVVTSEESPATAHEFFFWTAETEAAQNLDIGHIVAAESEDATAVAVLDDPRRYSDLQSFLDDFYAYDGDPSLEALSERVEILVFRARVLATKHRDERKKSKRPVRTGPVFFATNAAIEFALGTEDFSGHRIPMLLHENGNEENGRPQRTPLYVDEEYLLGPEAGHLNITGMSGLSTKTSHALFTIASTFQTVKDKKVAALMFNVKGADLLFLDKPVEVSAKDDPELAERYAKVGQRGLPREDREMYESLGIEIKAFRQPENLRPVALRDGVRRADRARRGDPRPQAEHLEERARRRFSGLPDHLGAGGRAALRRLRLRAIGHGRQVQGVYRGATRQGRQDDGGLLRCCSMRSKTTSRLPARMARTSHPGTATTT